MSSPIPPRPDLGPGAWPVPPAQHEAPSVTWRWWEALLVGAIGLIFLGGLLQLAVVGVTSPGHVRRLLLSVAGEGALAGAVLLWLFAMHRRSIPALEFHPTRWKDLLVGLGAGLAIYVVAVFGVGSVVETIVRSVLGHRVHGPRQLPRGLDAPQAVLAGAFVLLAAPIAEELFFRGFLFRALRARHGFLLSGAVSALFFGAAHVPTGRIDNGIVLGVVMVFVGMGLAYVYERRQNLGASMAAHAAFNTVGFLFILNPHWFR